MDRPQGGKESDTTERLLNARLLFESQEPRKPHSISFPGGGCTHCTESVGHRLHPAISRLSLRRGSVSSGPHSTLRRPRIHFRGVYNRGWQEVFSLLLLRTDSKLSPQSFICRIRPRKPRTNYCHREEGTRRTLPAPSWTLARQLCARARTRSPATGPGGWQKVGREGGGWEPAWLALPASFLTSVNGSIAPDFACRLRDGQNGGSNSEKEKWVPSQCVTWRKQEGGGELPQAPLLFPTASEVRLGLQRRFKFEFQRPDPRACVGGAGGRARLSWPWR